MNAPRSHTDRKSVVVILGPTAVGKSAVAIELARKIGGEVISADSRAFFRGLDITTDKPSSSVRREIFHHLLDVVEFDGQYDAMAFRQDADRLINEIQTHGRIPIVAGGGTLYLAALLRGLFDGPGSDRTVRRTLLRRPLSQLYQKLTELDPVSAEKIHPHDRMRIVRALEVYQLTGRPISDWHKETQPLPYRFFVFGLRKERAVHRQAIEARCQRMLDRGLVDEVRKLRENGLRPPMQAYRTIAVPEVFAYLDGEIDREELKRQMIHRTRQLVRRQMAWFSRDETVVWIDATYRDHIELAEEIVDLLPKGWKSALS